MVLNLCPLPSAYSFLSIGAMACKTHKPGSAYVVDYECFQSCKGEQTGWVADQWLPLTVHSL